MFFENRQLDWVKGEPTPLISKKFLGHFLKGRSYAVLFPQSPGVREIELRAGEEHLSPATHFHQYLSRRAARILSKENLSKGKSVPGTACFIS